MHSMKIVHGLKHDENAPVVIRNMAECISLSYGSEEAIDNFKKWYPHHDATKASEFIDEIIKYIDLVEENTCH